MKNYSIQRHFEIINETISSGSDNLYGFMKGEKLFQLEMEIDFDKLVSDEDYYEIITNSSFLDDCFHKMVDYIHTNEEEIQKQLQLVTYEGSGFGGFTQDHERNKSFLRFTYKNHHSTVQEFIDHIHKVYEEYSGKVVGREKKASLHPDLMVRLKDYLNENAETIKSQKVLEFLSQVESIKRYEKYDPNWGTDYEFYVGYQEEEFNFYFPKSFEPESDAEFLSDSDVEEIYDIFADIPLFWD